MLTFAGLLGAMSPYLLLGFFFAGLLHAYVPRRVYARCFSGSGFRSVALAALFGVPLPLCSCGVIPAAMSMRREGASKAATVSFMIATPQTGVDSVLATAALLGLPFALLRPVAALVTALFGGMLTGALTRKDGADCADAAPETDLPRRSAAAKFAQALRYGFVDMMQDIGRWLVIGLVLAGLIAVFLPDDFFAAFNDYPLANMALVLLLSVPMYICATGSIPIAAALMLKGLSPGTALVLLMAGPATNLAAMLVVGKVLGRGTLALYLSAIVAGAAGFGLMIDYIFPQEWFVFAVAGAVADSCHEGLAWWQLLSGVVFLLLLGNAYIMKYKKRKTEKEMETKRTFRIKGMVCNHCRAAVEKSLARIAGVTAVEVDLARGTASVSGRADRQEVIAAIEGLGYECVENS